MINERAGREIGSSARFRDESIATAHDLRRAEALKALLVRLDVEYAARGWWLLGDPWAAI